jgi:hypothetical protein
MVGPEFTRRVNKWTPEQLAPYQGKFVAWATREELDKEILRLGVTDWVEDYIPTDEEIIGGLW